MKRGGGQFAQDHVVTLELGEEVQAQGPVPLFFAQTVGREKGAGQKRENQRQDPAGPEQGLPLLRGRKGALPKPQQAQPHPQHRQRQPEPQPMRPPPPRGHLEFTMDDGQEHEVDVIASLRASRA